MSLHTLPSIVPPANSQYQVDRQILLPPLSSIIQSDDHHSSPPTYSAPSLPSLTRPALALGISLPNYYLQSAPIIARSPYRPLGGSAGTSPTSAFQSPLPWTLPESRPVVETKPAAKKESSTKPEAKVFAFISHCPATFPSQEPAIDNAPLARRKRRRTSSHELSILQLEFNAGPNPNKARRQQIAQRVQMDEKAVQIWFQNKRQSVKRRVRAGKGKSV